MNFRRSFVLLILVGLMSQLALAQVTTGTITGFVNDPASAAVPGATVVATQLETGVRGQTLTSSAGNYVILNLAVGPYQLSVTAPGFKTWTRTGISLFADQTARVDVALEIGATTERVEVTGQAPALKTETTDVSTTMEAKLVEDLPIAVAGVGGGMRNAFGLSMMMPFVRSGNGQTAGDDFQIAGGQLNDWNLSIDGLTAEIGWRNFVSYNNSLLPNLDTIQEFRNDTAAFKAEQGRMSGGSMTAVVKSGTNSLHGRAFDYYDTQHLDANSWLNNKLGRAKSIYHRNDFGAMVDGPVFIPGLYNGKNKTFFLLSYEGYRFPSTAGASLFTVPTPAMLKGDFSGWTNSSGAVIPIYDPHTTTVDGSGTTVRQIFPGNVIPVSQISPIARNLGSFYPAANLPGIVNNYTNPGNAPNKAFQNAWTSKMDQAFGVKSRVAVTWTRNYSYTWRAYTDDPSNLNNWPGLPAPMISGLQSTNSFHFGEVFRVNDTYLITPTIVNTLVLGFTRMHERERYALADPPGQNWGTKLGGFGNYPYSNVGGPSITFADGNYSSSSALSNYDEFSTSYGLDESLSWIKGSHSFKFGFGAQILDYDTVQAPRSSFTFSRLGTSVPGNNNGNSGNAYASLMLGAVNNANFSTPSNSDWKWSTFAMYAQDDWKISPRLTANIGLRVEVVPGMTDRYDHITYLDAALPNPAADGFPGALRFSGSGAGSTGSRTPMPAATGWGPRLGLAYRLSEKTVIRSGGGIFFSPSKERMGGSSLGYVSSPSFTSPNQGITPAFYWDNGYPAWQAPPNLTAGFGVGASSPTWFQFGDYKRLSSQDSWNFAISHQFPFGMVLDVTYEGIKGTHLEDYRGNYNQIDPKYAYLGSLLTQPINSPAVAALGFKPPFPDFQSVMGNNATLGQSLRRFPQYINVATEGRFGNSTFHALVIKGSKLYSNGLSLVAVYTWSKQLTDSDFAASVPTNVGSSLASEGGAAQNAYNLRNDKSYATLDEPHTIKVTASYDLPFGKGKKYLGSGIGSYIIGNWNIATYAYAQSGFPLGVLDTGYANNLNSGPARPNVTSANWLSPTAGSSFDPSSGTWLITSPFVRRTNPAADPFGNAPRYNGNARSPRTVRQNFSIARAFYVREKASLNLRIELFDAWNNKTWGVPTLDLANSQFGVITSAAGNRTGQASLKFVF
jgi:hypothetical protein